MLENQFFLCKEKRVSTFITDIVVTERDDWTRNWSDCAKENNVEFQSTLVHKMFIVTKETEKLLEYHCAFSEIEMLLANQPILGVNTVNTFRDKSLDELDASILF